MTHSTIILWGHYEEPECATQRYWVAVLSSKLQPQTKNFYGEQIPGIIRRWELRTSLMQVKFHLHFFHWMLNPVGYIKWLRTSSFVNIALVYFILNLVGDAVIGSWKIFVVKPAFLINRLQHTIERSSGFFFQKLQYWDRYHLPSFWRSSQYTVNFY